MLQTIHKGTLSAKDVLEEWAKQAMPLPDLEIDLGRPARDQGRRARPADGRRCRWPEREGPHRPSRPGQAQRDQDADDGLSNCSQALHEAHDRLQTFNPLADKVAVDGRTRWSGSQVPLMGTVLGETKKVGDLCPNPRCRRPLERKRGAFYWRGSYADGAHCVPCSCALGHRRRRDRAAAAGPPSQIINRGRVMA